MSTTSSNASSNGQSWQERLEELCQSTSIPSPSFQIVSDRRGGRTAWSSQVVVNGQSIAARFWYDGKNLNNAKEDAAEVALNYLVASGVAYQAPIHSQQGW
ncbi:hypothetical protein BROUX41_000701 [Berkeleyomyces rouxiae]|uniref:uncharacterized protein n=1 Tax=Berkeleyomyces rouxiae TaxID=2035830 RepID=UPI003B769A48